MTTRDAPIPKLRAVMAALIATLAMTLPSPSALAQRSARGVTVEASVADQRVFVGEPVRLQISIAGAKSPPPPDLSGLRGIEARFLGGQDVSRSFTSIVNGRRTDESFDAYVFVYELTATKPGEIIIPPIELIIDAVPYRTEPITLTAFDAQADPDVKLRLEIDNPEPYEGEPVRLRVVWGLTRQPTAPRFTIPGVDGAFEVVGPARDAQRDDNVVNILGVDTPLDRGEATFDGQQLTTFTGELILIPRRSGEATLGPATVACGVVVRQGRGFFAQDETRKVVAPSNALLVRIKPLPTDGKPANFAGLVGRYTIAAAAEPREVNVGDPISLTIRATGPLAASAPAPTLSKQKNLSRDFRIGEDARPPTGTRESVIWERTLRALRDDVLRIPPIELPFFDPHTGRYDVARSQEITLLVRPTRVVTAADAVTAEPGVADPAAPAGPGVPIEDLQGGLRYNDTGPALLADHSFDLASALRSPLTLGVLFTPPLAYAGLGAALLLRRIRGRRESARSRRRRALASALDTLRPADENGDHCNAVSAALRTCFADWFDRDPDALTAADCLALASDADDQTRAALMALLARCDIARFGAAGESPDRSLRHDAERVLRDLDKSIGGAS